MRRTFCNDSFFAFGDRQFTDWRPQLNEKVRSPHRLLLTFSYK
nr:MAG TPA: hypothetical protein [Caudoviricetes sp.]